MRDAPFSSFFNHQVSLWLSMRNVNSCKLSRVLLLLLSQGPQTPAQQNASQSSEKQSWIKCFSRARLPGHVPGNVCGWRMLGCCFEDADTAGPSVCEIQEIFIPAQAPGIPATLSPRGILTEEVETFTVAVPTKNFVTLGLELELTEARAPMISSIEEGAVQEFNKVYKHSRIQPFDVLLALDGTHSWEAIQEKLTSKLPDTMFLTLNRPRKIQVAVENTGNMGITLAFSDKSAGVVIQELHPSGMMVEWNAKRKSQGREVLEVLDRIIEFDGKAYCGTDLANLLEEKKHWRLTVLKYQGETGEMPVLEGLSRRSFGQ